MGNISKSLLTIFSLYCIANFTSCKKHLTCEDVVVTVSATKTSVDYGETTVLTGSCNLPTAIGYWISPDGTETIGNAITITNASTSNVGNFKYYVKYGNCVLNEDITISMNPNSSCTATNTFLNSLNSSSTFTSFNGTGTDYYSNNYLSMYISSSGYYSNQYLHIFFNGNLSDLNGTYTLASSPSQINSTNRVSLQYEYKNSYYSYYTVFNAYPNQTGTITASQDGTYLYIKFCEIETLENYYYSKPIISASLKIPLSSL